MGRRWAFLACLCGLLVFAPALHASETAVGSKGEQLLLEEINRVRAAHGVRPLKVDARLQAAAQAHSRDMLRHGYLGHGNFGRRLQNYGVRGKAIGENVAWGSGGRVRAKAVVAQWLASEGHRANLLSPAFRKIGVGAVVGRFGGYRHAHFVTADFSA